MLKIKAEIDSEEYCYKHCSVCDKEFDINSDETVYLIALNYDEEEDYYDFILCNKCRKLLGHRLMHMITGEY